MSRSRRGKKAGEDAERLLQEAFGVSEDQLLKDFILAQTEVKDSDIPPEPEDGFERLMAKLEAEVGTSPESEKESSSENIVKLHEEVRKPRRLKTIVKVSVAAAAIAVMGISAGAKREYRYVVREKDSVRNEIVLNNVEAIPGEDELDKAYIEIAKKTKIQAIRFAYIPEKMHYIKTDITSTRVVMYFEYDKYRVKIIQQFRDGGNSTNIISDRKKAMKVHNDLLNEDINIQQAKIDSGEMEYSAIVIKGAAYYQISGIMPQKEFKKIVENMYLEKY